MQKVGEEMKVWESREGDNKERQESRRHFR